jgi:hypothetical protein
LTGQRTDNILFVLINLIAKGEFAGKQFSFLRIDSGSQKPPIFLRICPEFKVCRRILGWFAFRPIQF